MEKLLVRRSLSGSLENVVGMHPLLQRIFKARGISDLSELELESKALLSYESLSGIDLAVSNLLQALKQQQRILILGDFDVDGATSTAIAVRALRAFGYKHVNYLIPSRFEYGYGLSPEIVAVAARENPDLIITVDNGIGSISGVNTAKKLGIKVLITDHHLPGNELPDACAIVNPNQPNDQFASKNLAGVGVIFYLMLALRRALRDLDWFSKNNIPEPNMTDFYDLLALGTVADIVQLDKNNRILVHQGVRRIRAGKCCSGIKALLRVTGRSCENVSASDLGFVLAPRLNAAGRLDDMSLGIECLLTDDFDKALSIANELNTLNDERKAIEVDMQQQAMRDLENLQLTKDLPLGLCLFDQAWHQGVVGILASRVKDSYHRPVIAFAKVDVNEIKGSARSIQGLHIRDLIEQVAVKNPGLITKFGGHAMAAGLTLSLENYQKFCQVFLQELQKTITKEDLTEKIYTDGELESEQFSLEIAELLQNSGPWGHAFPEPLFEGVFDVLEQTLVGRKHLKLSLGVPKSGKVVDAIAFNVDLDSWPNDRCNSIQAVFRLDINEYRGQRNLQLIIEHVRPNH